MTLGDVAAKVVLEITGEDEEKVRVTLKLAFDAADRHSAFTDQISNREAMRIYAYLRRDPSDLLRLYASGKKTLSEA
jgi:hypothetical protein